MLSLFASYLVNGYIRDIQHMMDCSVVPDPVITLCSRFYERFDILLYLRPKGLHIANLNSDNLNKHENWKCKIYDIDKDDGDVLLNKQQWFCKHAGLNYAKNVKLPSMTCTKINNMLRKYSFYSNTKVNDGGKPYNVLFRCGGKPYNMASNKCNGFIIDESEILTNKIRLRSEYLKCFNWTLPSFPVKIYGNYLLYTKKNGLVSIFGDSNLSTPDDDHCYKLSLDDNCSNDEWKWQKIKLFTNNKKKQISQRTNPSAISCTSDGGRKEIFIVFGGYHNNKYLNEVQLGDIKSGKLTNLSPFKIARCEAGVYYDQHGKQKNIYLAGGDSDRGALHNVETFNVIKQKWFNDIPSTVMQHENYPILWMINRNLLAIASMGVLSNGLEWIDLRDDSKKWKAVYIPKTNKSLSYLFGVNVPLDPYNVSNYRFIK